jgi:hypothetical protein
MTTRERFHMVMNADPAVDRSPAIEWAPWWDKTLEFWEKEGLPHAMSGEEVSSWFHLDSITQFWFPHYAEDCPKPASEYVGPGIVQNEEDYARLKKYFYPEDAVKRMKEQIVRTIPQYNSGNTIVWYTVNGFFWFPRELFGDEAHLFAFYDYPELYHQICEDLLQWQIRQIDLFSEYMHADFMTIAEDMSYNKGSMISRRLFQEFMLPYYKRLIPEIKKYGTKVFVDSDGNIGQMIPWFIEAGADGILPLERQAGVDLVKLREEYPEFMFIGGFDKMAILHGDKKDIRKEFERLLPVIRSGRYLIGMDHQTPPGTSMENYRYYVECLREYGAYACK